MNMLRTKLNVLHCGRVYLPSAVVCSEALPLGNCAERPLGPQ